MPPKHFFSFGYVSPDEFRWNSANGTDDESSTGFWITDASEEEALNWGQAVAERFVAWLFERAGQEGYSWTEGKFACWLETDPSVLTEWRAANLPAVVAGEEPPFEALAS